jgi:cytosine/adenosine deaminase-related metal-dependent hydrolase
LRPSLSVDVETEMPGDLFTQMRAVFTLQRMQAVARQREGGAAPRLLTARDVVDFATVQGARANHLDRVVGTISPGKQADVILLRTDAINVMPVNNADTSNVDTVIIGGAIRKRNGQLVGVDLANIRRTAQRSRDYIVSKTGWPKSIVER